VTARAAPRAVTGAATAASLGPYLAVISARFRVLLQYRAAAVAGMSTQVFFGLVRVMILEAFYRSATPEALARQPMNPSDIAGYVWLGQAFLAMLPWNVDSDIRQMVRSGSIAYELTRPVDLYALWYARALALRTAPVLLRAVPLFLFAMLGLPLIGLSEWRLSAPPSLASGLSWACAMVGALLLSAALTTLLNITLLFTISGEGIVVFAAALVMLLSGMTIPLPLFPAWSQPLLRSLPFAGLVDLPFRLYTGNLPAAEAGWVLLHQVLWTVGLVAAGRWLLRHALSRVVVQGG
jgi:ABC-2 type transport system permease protein